MAQAWSIGYLGWKLFHDQAPIYDFLSNCPERTVVVNIARQFGKTFLLCLIALEYGIQHPGSLIRFVTGSIKALRKMVLPNMRELLRDCPASLRPDFVSQDSLFRFPNGSELHMAAANDGHADDSRGQRAHLCVVDEAGFVDELDYLVASVLRPQTLTTGGRILIVSTPPVTPAHDFFMYAMRAQSKGAYIVRTLDDNKHISAKEKEILLAEMGGRQSTQAKREAFCQFVVDETRAIIPEYTAEADAEIVQPVPALTYEFPLVAMDVGFEDLHAILYGYWDFRRAMLCVQAEDALQRATTDRIAATMRATEARLWTDAKRKEEPVRWSDTDLRLIADLGHEHRLAVIPTAKDDLEAQVNAVRLLVKARKIQIDPACKLLRHTLLVGIWNKSRTSFERAPGIGHADMTAALIYMARNANRFDNPYPAVAEGILPHTHHIPVSMTRRQSEQAESLRDAFVRRR